MPLPAPKPGLGIALAYLWRREHRQGQEDGRRVRPATIVLAVQNLKGAAPRVTVAPITHTILKPISSSKADQLTSVVRMTMEPSGSS